MQSSWRTPRTQSLQPRPKASRGALVGCALGNPDDFDTAVLLVRAGLTAAGACHDSRGVDALLAEVFHSVGSAVSCDFLGLALLRIGVPYDHRGTARLALQTQRNVVENALADVVDARAQRLAKRALVHLARLRQRRHGLYLNASRSFGRSSSPFIYASRDGVAGGRKPGRLKVPSRTVSRYPPPSCAPRVAKRVAVGVACIAGNMHALTCENCTAVR